MRQPGVDLYLSVFGFESGRLGMGIMDPGSMVFWVISKMEARGSIFRTTVWP